jgi:hypothetical protein
MFKFLSSINLYFSIFNIIILLVETSSLHSRWGPTRSRQRRKPTKRVTECSPRNFRWRGTGAVVRQKRSRVYSEMMADGVAYSKTVNVVKKRKHEQSCHETFLRVADVMVTVQCMVKQQLAIQLWLRVFYD